MRERTPSADDTPKRAPPAPSREAASADVAGSEIPNDDTVEGYHTAKLSGIPLASSSALSSDRMVASTQSLDDLGVNHPANAAGNADRQQHQQQQQQLQERYGHAYRSSAQTAQDKRSRLSNVINNLRKKVPDGAASENSDSLRKDEDDRNSVERNLETLQKYVMTVLNGVIKDNEEEDKNAEKTKELEKQRKGADEEKEEEEEEEEEEEDPTDTAVKSEPSSEGDIEAAVVPRLEDSSTIENAEDVESSETADCLNMKKTAEESVQDSEVRISQDSKQSPSRMEEECLDVEEKESSKDDRSVSRENKESRTLSTIIMDRLSEHQVEERANVDDGRGNRTRDEHAVSRDENTEMRTICDELLNDLLRDVYRTIDDHENQKKIEDCEKSKKTDATESRVEEKTKDSSISIQEQSVTSLHCSLPLDKVASVLQNCQTSESVTSRLSSGSPLSPPSAQKKSSCTTPPVRLLCLYCDRKFLSMSLRQRHTERAHQLGGGRRSGRNLRKPSQNCQYCSEKCADTLEALFQHMVGTHGDKYHACVQCSTRYPTREALVGHMGETHGGNTERIGQVQSEKIKEGSPVCKEFYGQNLREMNMPVRERKSEEKESEDHGNSRRSDSSRTKLIATREPIDNPASPEFDSSFYSNVSCNIRENLLHHLDGKLQTMSGPSSCTPPIATSSSTAVTTMTESKSPQQQPQQSYYEHSVNQIQFPIDISLTAATPVYNKEYSASEEYENSSEYARKAGKTSSGSRPRRVSFEKYNFPRKYDGREQWTCSIKDLSKFDIYTQLSLRKKQQLIKERLTISRLHQIPLLSCETTEVSLRDQEQIEPIIETAASNQDNADAGCVVDVSTATFDVVCCDVGEPLPSETKKEMTTALSVISTSSASNPTIITEFNVEFADFMRLRRREEGDNDVANGQEIVYAELSGEWSRIRIYICGACGSRHVTLKEMEDHKASTHPRVLCSHFELVGDQREYYKHLYLPGRDAPTDAARDACLTEMVCTKCAKSCPSVSELHRHMLECGGDQAWLLGLTGSGKKKCKWRPFGSRSRRRRQRGMKRNIQNSQTQPRIVNVERSKEKQTPTGPRVRPSDRESIQKMLANLPAKRATRRVLQDSMIRSQGRLRNMQTRTKPHMIGDNSSRISRNKAALRNKLLKNAKSIQRNRCRSDNIAAVIESVVRKCHETEKKSDGDKSSETENEGKKDAKEVNEGSPKVTSKTSDQNDRTVRPKVVGRPKVLGKRRNVKNPQLQRKSDNKLAKTMSKFAKFKNGTISETKGEGEETSSPKSTPKNTKTTSKTVDKDDGSVDSKKMSTILGVKSKNKSTQGMLKRKRPVDPVASLNASLKAKSQLRTQDGKFARNPNKSLSAKLSETKMDDGKHRTPQELIVIKPKLKTKLKKKAKIQLPRRVTRLSSDSDKMPTLEPVVQIVSSNEEYVDKSTNDLPILSPVTSSLQDQKASRNLTKCVLKEKEGNVEANAALEAEKSKKEQKSTRGRKPKQKTKDIAKQKKINTVEENKVSKNNIAALKDDKVKGRKNLSVISTNSSENNKEEMSKRETIVKKDSRLKKEEITKETRSNSKTRIDKEMKLSDIPFEVKKLLGSASKEDLLNTLELASNDSKRSLRQLTPRSKILQVSDKSSRDIDDESNESKSTSKKEKIEVFRKSSRKNIEKKSDKTAKTSLEKDSSNAIASAAQNERSQQGKKDRTAKTKEIAVDSNVEDKTDGRQTRGSSSDAKSEPSLEIASDSLRKGSGLLGKRRSRNRSIDEDKETNTRASEEQSSNENVTSSEKEVEKDLDKVCKKTKGEDKNSDDRLDSTVVNVNLSHLQSETSNLSVDSGKENSLETPVNVHSKVKVGRPKKTWGARREKSSRKRSLNNVIGILTEGMNIPIEAQQNVQVLTVQTSLDNSDRVARNGSVQQPSGGEGNVIAVDSAFSELSVLAKSEEESTENEAVMATSTTDSPHAGEKNASACPEIRVENVFVDVSSKATTACSPANDIILDLSRRKPKGKGSFLEKIVSKIAKQKDALLEGEVGSLLDTAADELTSILDEVGPTLGDNLENANSDETSHASKNDNDKNMTVTSTDKELSAIVNSKIQVLENDKINVESAKCSTDSLETSNNLEENLLTKTEMQKLKCKNQTKVDDVSDVEMKNGDDMGRKMSDAMCPTEESHVESCENKLTMNKEAVIPIEIANESPASLTDTSSSFLMKQKENLEKLERKVNVPKSRRKSNKRSLENASCSKKSKKRPLEIVEDHTEEDDMQKKSDIITFKAKDTFNVGNEFSKDRSIVETLNAGETEIDTLLQHSENEIKTNLKLNLKKDLTKANELSLEKFSDLPEVACENVKLTLSLKESLDKTISDENAVVSNDQSTELVEKNADFSMLSLEKSVECEKSANKIQKKDQTDTNESSSKRTSKRKSQPALSVTSPIDAATDSLQTSGKLFDETEKVPLESTNVQSKKIGTISEDSDISLEKLLYSEEIASEKHKETQNTNDSNLVNLTPSKTTKKRGAKKKSLADEHLELPKDKPAEVAPKLNDESNIADSNKQLSVSLENFKIPEVKDLLQSGKKRSPKKKSQSEDGRWNGGSVSEESRTNEVSTEISEMSNLIEEKVEEQEKIEKRTLGEESSTKRLERSSSSGSIGLTPSSTKTRSMFKKKTQLSSEDLANSSIRSAESTDDLSESSCASESSYFRKKRFAKKKRKEETVIDDNARDDVSITDPIDPKSDKQNSKGKTSKTKSLLDEHLDLSDVDDIDIPMDIQASLENTEALENIEREFELAEKSLDLQDEDADKQTDDTENKDSYALERPASNNHDSPDNPVTPKKRGADNFVVVHTKTGEILIVEKRKKLTKEAARFFCDVCATSFTRKSSLKKHTLSQSHLLQMAKFTKDKIEPVDRSTSENAEGYDNEWKSNQENDQQTESISEDARTHETVRNSLELDESYVPYAANAESTKPLVDLGNTRQMLEDKLLDEEICKITENMSHDEYVLTDHVTPEEPMLSSTPIKSVQKKQEDSGRDKNTDKKRNKSKKRNLAEEHLLLDSPELEKSKIDSDELSKLTDDVVQISSPSCDHTLTKETIEMVEKIEDVSKKCVDVVETKNQSKLIVESSLNEETSLACDIDAKAERQTESRTTRRRLRKVSKVDNEEKEELSALTETNRFSLRPRRSKNIQHYEESDIEADVYFMDTSMEINSDETENNCCVQERQDKAEEETNRNALQENTRADVEDKNSQNAEVAKSKTDSTNDTKKRKRGRPRLKDRIVPNSSVVSAHIKSKVNENDVVATDNLDESKIKNQKLDLHTKERLDETDKVPYIDTSSQLPKRSRGRPRKNPISIANSSLVQADNSSASESTKSNHDEIKEKTDAIESRSIEEITSISSLISNAESSAVQEHAESSLSETKKDLLNAEETRSIESSVSEDQLAQRIEEATDIEINNTVLGKNTLTLNIPSENVELAMPSEMNIRVDDTKCVQEDIHNDDTSVNILTNLTTESSAELFPQLTEQVDDMGSVESKVIGLDNDESVKVQKLTDVSEEKQMKSEEKFPEEVPEEAKLSSESEDSEDEALITDDKSLPIASPHKSQKMTDDLENDNVSDERATPLESSNKKLSRKSTSKERETDRKRLKTSKGKRKKVKVAELSSDSENEDDRIESVTSSKSKIVKSVFGRVFGGEKADKVKEVLNDWVSRSEDDSDMSRSASEAKSYLRGPTKFSENGHKKEKKCHSSSETKKDIERSSRKKGNDKCSSEIHGKAKNRKKREKDVEPIPEDRIKSPVNLAKRRYRESKIRADEKILRTFDDESPTVSDEDDKIKETSDQINNELNDKDEETRGHHETELHKERTKDKNLTSENWESLRVDHDTHGKSKNSSSHRKKKDVNERSSSPSQSNMFKYKRRESKTRAGEKIWRVLDDDIFSYSSDDLDELYEPKNLNRSESIKEKDDDAWKNASLTDQEPNEAHSGRGRSRKDSSNCKRQDSNVIKISKMKMNKKAPRDSDNDLSIPLKGEMENETQNDQTIPSTNESRNRSKTLIKDDAYESFKETSDQINNELNDKDEETRGDHEKELHKERTKDLTSENWESLQVEHDSHGKSKNSSSHRKKKDERSSSPSQSNMFKYRRRESKTKAGEKIWRVLDDDIFSYSSDDLDELYEPKNLNRSDTSKSIKQKDDDAWKNANLIDQEQNEAHSGRGRSRKDSSNCKRQDSNVIKISKTKMNKKAPRDSDNDSLIPSRGETENETQNQTIPSTNEPRNRSKTLIKDDAYESFFYGDSVVSKHMNKDQNNLLAHLDRSTSSRKNKKEIVNEDWKRSVRNLESDQEDDQPAEKEIGRKDEESAISSHSYSSSTAGRSIMKNQLADENSHTNRKSNDNDNDDEEEEESDNDLGRRRMSPFYVRDSSIENSSNEEEEDEEEEEEDGEEEEEEDERITHEDNSRKTSLNEFSGEKIIIRSPSSGHRSDVVMPTDAIEDNALDVPREIESTIQPRQGKILNFDEELFVECCSRLKATSENELRGAKKIKLDHTESYHKRDDQPQGFRVNRDRWKDVESQNSLGSLLESVNQLLGEEMYNSHDRSYRTRGSERSSRSASPDTSRVDNLGYEDSLDVAFEHNNKLRDKIQQRMRESENLIATTFGQKINDTDHPDNDKRDSVGNSYSSSIHEHEQLSMSVVSNREQEPSSGHKNKMNSTLGGLHKALSNLLHNNGKHDHNGSAPMKLLAELACARAPTSTSPEDTTNSSRNHQSVKMVAAAVAAAAAAAVAVVAKDTPISPKRPTKDSAVTPKNSPTKKTRNPIKELFERKKEINDRKEQERSKAALVELNVQKQRKSKKNKKQQQVKFPLIRRSEHYGGLVEKKKRRDSLDRKGESERIKDVYEFDEEESQIAPTLGSVMSYRSQVDKCFETNWPRMKNIDGDLDAVLENSKTNYVTDMKLDAMINRKFQELEKFAPKTKGALKSYQSEEQQQQQQVVEPITGPMDEFVERKQQRVKRPIEQSVKQSGGKKRGKSSKKRVRNAWYENDSSDEFRTAAKAEDVGVGISKSQRSCSKGKQNLFAELSTSSESEYERDDVDYANEQRSSKSRKCLKKLFDADIDEADDQCIVNESEFDNEDQIASNWNREQEVQEDAMKNDHDVAKSESEMSDYSLVIDERKMTDEARNSDDDADNQYERTFELDDLYREDSSDAETEVEENEEPIIEEAKNKVGTQTLDENATLQEKFTSTNTKDNCAPHNELISLEDALDLLDRQNLDSKAENVRAKNKNIINGTMDETSNDGIVNEEMENKCLSPVEMQDEKEEADDDVPVLPEKLSSNEKPQKESDHNLPLHVFLSRKVQESKKRKQQQLDKLREEQERILLDFQPTRRQRKCAIGKQGLLAEISSSDEELYVRDRKNSDHDKSRKKRESKEKRKERYLEKKHEQMIAKEQKAIEEEILREVGKRKESLAQGVDDDAASNADVMETISEQIQRKKHQMKEKHKKSDENIEENTMYIGQSSFDGSDDNHNKSDHSFSTENNIENNDHSSTSPKRKRFLKSPAKSKKVSKSENGKIPTSKKSKEPTEKSKKTSTSNKDSKERRSSNGKHDSDDEELKTTKSWNKVEEGVGVAIGRRKRTAALQLYYWSSTSDEEETPEPIPAAEEEEDDRQEQHGWIVGDSHKRMITMLAMEKQLKEKRRRSEDEFELGKTKSKKHRNSTS